MHRQRRGCAETWVSKDRGHEEVAQEHVDAAVGRPDQREKDGDCRDYDECVDLTQGAYNSRALEIRNTVKSVPFGVRG